MNKPMVSVIINNYNYGRFLKKAIDSAVRQTYIRKEVLVVDDGSKDESINIIKNYNNGIIPILKDNGGQGSAFNAGFDACRGDIICFLDSDDYFFPIKLERVIHVVSKYKSKEWSYLRHNLNILYEIDKSNYIKSIEIIPGIKDEEHSEIISEENVLILRRNSPTTSIVAPRWALEKIFPVPQGKFKISADAYLYSRLPPLGKTISIRDILGVYRVHGSNLYYLKEANNVDVINKIMKIELEILKYISTNARYNSEILKYAHILKSNYPEYINILGKFQYRMRRIIGNPTTLFNDTETLLLVLKNIIKEVLRSLK